MKMIFTKNAARKSHYGGARVHKGSMATLSGQKASSQSSDHLSMILRCLLATANKEAFRSPCLFPFLSFKLSSELWEVTLLCIVTMP